MNNYEKIKAKILTVHNYNNNFAYSEFNGFYIAHLNIKSENRHRMIY